MIQKKSLTVSLTKAAHGTVPLYPRVVAFVFLIVTYAVFLPIDVHAQAPKQPGTSRPTKKSHQLRITDGDIMGVSLKAEKARMTDIAADLAKRLNTSVRVGPSLQKEALTVEFADLSFDPAMGLIAPRVFVDYEIRSNAKPKMLAIYLMGFEDPEPAANETVKSSSEAIMIEGNTEDEPASPVDYEADPLQVDRDDNFLTIRSKKQPLIAVVLTIAEVLEVPAEIRYESTEIIDTVIKDTPFEDAIIRLSPNIRLYVRANLGKSIRTPLRLSLVPPVPPVEKTEVVAQ